MAETEQNERKLAIIAAATITNNAAGMVGDFVPDNHLLKNPIVKDSMEMAAQAAAQFAALPDIVKELQNIPTYHTQIGLVMRAESVNRIVENLKAMAGSVKVSPELFEMVKGEREDVEDGPSLD